MTGIERLRELADAVTGSVWANTSSGYCGKYGFSIKENGGSLTDALAGIADQIEAEQEERVTRRIEDREAAEWVREHGGLDSVKKLLDWVVGHCSTKQQLDFDFWLSGRVMHELGFDEDMADRDEVERRLLDRLMPEGMEWPTVDGKPVVIGERMRSCGIDDCKVVGIDPANSRLILASDNIEEGKATYFTDSAEYCHRPTPKVLDADGVEIHVGDTVYHVKDGSEMTVYGIGGEWLVVSVGSRARHDTVTHRAPVLAADGRPLREGETVWDTNGDELVIGALEDGGHTVTCRYVDVGDAIPVHGMWSPSQLTHERPASDTWERLEEDCAKSDVDYCVERGLLDPSCDTVGGEGSTRHCTDCGCTCGEKMARDLVRRAKKLAGVSE